MSEGNRFYTHKPPNAPYVCQECGEEFTHRIHYARHGLVHEEPNAYLCSECDKPFKIRQSMLNHQRKVHGTMPAPPIFTCQFCPKTFQSQFMLTNHQKLHEEVQESFKCEICNQNYRVKSSLDKHMQKDHRQLPRVTLYRGNPGIVSVEDDADTYKCRMCSKAYDKALDVKKHEKYCLENRVTGDWS